MKYDVTVVGGLIQYVGELIGEYEVLFVSLHGGTKGCWSFGLFKLIDYNKIIKFEANNSNFSNTKFGEKFKSK